MQEGHASRQGHPPGNKNGMKSIAHLQADTLKSMQPIIGSMTKKMYKAPQPIKTMMKSKRASMKAMQAPHEDDEGYEEQERL